MGGGWKEKAGRAKRLHRPSLKDWECDGYAESFPSLYQSISARENYESFIPFGSANNPDGSCSRIAVPAVLDALSTSVGAFQTEYEARGIPAVLQNIPEKEGWAALRRWADLDKLEHDPDLANYGFKVGEDDDGKTLKIKLKYFMKYLRENRDDSPLYIFDSAFDDDRDAKRLLQDYKVPSYFDEDLFHLVGERRRPPYRWFLVGPERSGTTVHIDPLGTAAWNTLIYGQKRWVLFPPHVPKHIAKGKGLIRRSEDDEAIHYFDFILPRIKSRAAASDGTGDYENFACYEFTQNAGETVYIPYGWWHAVLNMTHTAGITQNFCSQRNFDIVWTKTRTGRKKMAYKWLRQLDTHYPRLAERARELNRKDGFVMKYEPEEVRKREREEEHRRKARKEAKAARREKKRKAKLAGKKSKSASSSRASSTSGSFGIVTTHVVGDRDSKRSRVESRAISPDTVSS